MVLNVPVPEVIDHAPVLAPPPTLAPLSVIGVAGKLIHVEVGPPGVTLANGLTLIVRVSVTAPHIPEGSLVVNFNVTVPVKPALGVYITEAGEAVCAVLLSEPPPDVIDHAPVVAEPPTLAPLKVIGVDGVAWQVASGPPASAVAATFTVIVIVVAICALQPVLAVVASTLNVVVVLNAPVDKFIVPPVPATALPTRLLSALFLSW